MLRMKALPLIAACLSAILGRPAGAQIVLERQFASEFVRIGITVDVVRCSGIASAWYTPIDRTVTLCENRQGHDFVSVLAHESIHIVQHCITRWPNGHGERLLPLQYHPYLGAGVSEILEPDTIGTHSASMYPGPGQWGHHLEQEAYVLMRRPQTVLRLLRTYC